MENESRKEFVDLESYLFPETRKLLEEIESRLKDEVKLQKVFNSNDTWQVSKENAYYIDMPEWDEGNKICFTHELLHIYFDFCLGMKVTDLDLISLSLPYIQYFEDPWQLSNHYITLINNLQHHKMIPYFEAYNFPTHKIIDNYDKPTNLFEDFENNLKTPFDFQQPVHRYLAVLSYVNFLCVELYFPNPLVRAEMISSYSARMDAKFVGQRAIFEPILKRWATDFNDLRALIFDINKEAKAYAELGLPS